MSLKLIERKKEESIKDELSIEIEGNSISFSAYLDLRERNFNWCMFMEDLENDVLKIIFFKFMDSENAFMLLHPSDEEISYCAKPKDLNSNGEYILESIEGNLFTFKKVPEKGKD